MSQASTPDCSASLASWPRPLLDLLERQHAIVQQLAQLAESQSELVSASHADRLLDLLASRQRLIDEFAATQPRLAELTTGMEARLETVAPAQRDRIRSLIDTIGERLADVMRRDEQDQALLRSNRDQVKQELATLGAAKQARNAYTTGGPFTNRYADRRG